MSSKTTKQTMSKITWDCPKLWFSRDNRGNCTDNVYVWNKKPEWNPADGEYDLLIGQPVAILEQCSDFRKVMEALRPSEGFSSEVGIEAGCMIELSISAIMSKGESVAERAQELLDKTRNSEEITKFLESLVKDGGKSQ